MTTFDDLIDRLNNGSGDPHRDVAAVRGALILLGRRLGGEGSGPGEGLRQHLPVLSPSRSRHAGGTSPDLTTFGPLATLQFTVDVDEAWRMFKIPAGYVPDTLRAHAHWTKALNADESGRNVRWMLEYRVVDGKTMDVVTPDNTVFMEDTYEDNAADASRILYRADDVALPGGIANYYVAMRVQSVTPVGTPLLNDACLSSIDFTWRETLL